MKILVSLILIAGCAFLQAQAPRFTGGVTADYTYGVPNFHDGIQDNFAAAGLAEHLEAYRVGPEGFTRLRAGGRCNRLYAYADASFANRSIKYPGGQLPSFDAGTQGSAQLYYGGALKVFHPTLPLGTLVNLTFTYTISGDKSRDFFINDSGYDSYFQGSMSIANGNNQGPQFGYTKYYSKSDSPPGADTSNPVLGGTFTVAVGQTLGFSLALNNGVYNASWGLSADDLHAHCTGVWEWSFAQAGVELREDGTGVKLCGQIIPGKDNTCIKLDPAGHAIDLCFTSTAANQCVSLQASDDNKTWSTIASMITNPNKNVSFTDFPDAQLTRRFYRIILCPGQGIVYQRLSSAGAGTIWRCRMDGSDDFKLTDGFFPRVSPDGRYIAFIKKQSGSSSFAGCDIYLKDLATLSESSTPIFNNTSTTDEIHGLSFSHDSNSIAFDIGNSTAGYGIKVVPRTGGAATTVTGLTTGCSQIAPSIDPSGSGNFAFHERIPGRITKALVAGGGEVPLSLSGQGHSWPQYSWNGQWIAYVDGNVGVTQFDQGHDLHLISPNGTQRKTITTLDPGDGFPYGAVWTTDHQKLIGAASIAGQTGIWQVSADGLGTRKLIEVSSGDAPVFVGGVVQ